MEKGNTDIALILSCIIVNIIYVLKLIIVDNVVIVIKAVKIIGVRVYYMYTVDNVYGVGGLCPIVNEVDIIICKAEEVIVLKINEGGKLILLYLIAVLCGIFKYGFINELSRVGALVIVVSKGEGKFAYPFVATACAYLCALLVQRFDELLYYLA